MAGYKVLIGRVLVVLTGAVWLGGLVFYASVVIPTAHEVLGSHTTVGFITRQVTRWINVFAVVALAVFFLNLIATRRIHRSWLRFGFAGTWAVMAAVQVCLFILHPMLDRMLNAETQTILEPTRFYSLHRVYLIGTGIQLFVGLFHLVCVLSTWRRQDMTAHSVHRFSER